MTAHRTPSAPDYDAIISETIQNRWGARQTLYTCSMSRRLLTSGSAVYRMGSDRCQCRTSSWRFLQVPSAVGRPSAAERGSARSLASAPRLCTGNSHSLPVIIITSFIIIETKRYTVYCITYHKEPALARRPHHNETNHTRISEGWLGSVVVRVSDLRSRGWEFDSRPLHCRVASVNSAFHPSGG